MNIMTRIRYAAPLAMLGLIALSGGCGGGDDGGTTPPPDDDLAFERYDAGFLAIDKPRGWTVTIAGGCGTLAFLITDPDEPLRNIFYFGTVGPVYLSQAQKDLDAWYVAHGGFPHTWLDAPVVDPLTPENYLAHWPEIADMDAATAFMAAFPRLEQLQLIASTSQASMLPGGATAHARGMFAQNDRVAEGMFLATVLTYLPYNGNPGAGIGYGHFVCGVTAPHGEFAAISQRLVSSLDSFTITQAYVDNCLQQSQQQWGAVAAAGRTLSEASDIIWDGWVARSHSEDISAEQWTDANRGAWEMSGLQPLPGDAWELWMRAALDGASRIH